MTNSVQPDSNGWIMGEDGLLFRKAARIIATDEHGRLLLMKGHDDKDPLHRWWSTPGGGIDAGENPRHAAVREFHEETGVHLDPELLTGPVIEREAVFYFSQETRRQHEVFFWAKLNDTQARDVLTQEGVSYTDLEKEVLDGLAWRTLENIEADSALPQAIPSYPHNLPQVVRCLLDGWDGKVFSVVEK